MIKNCGRLRIRFPYEYTQPELPDSGGGAGAGDGTVTGLYVVQEDMTIYTFQEQTRENSILYDPIGGKYLRGARMRRDGKIFTAYWNNDTDKSWPVQFPRDLSEVEKEGEKITGSVQYGMEINPEVPALYMPSFEDPQMVKYDSELALLWQAQMTNYDGVQVAAVSVALDRNDNSYWAVEWYAGIQKRDPNGGLVWEWNSSQSDGSTEDYYSSMIDLVGDHLYLCGGEQIYKVSLDGVFQWEVTLNDPNDLTVAPDGTVYVTSNDATPTVRHLDTDGTEIKSISVGGGSSNQVSCDAKGNLYVCAGNEIQKYDPDGNNLFSFVPTDFTNISDIQPEPGNVEFLV